MKRIFGSNSLTGSRKDRDVHPHLVRVAVLVSIFLFILALMIFFNFQEFNIFKGLHNVKLNAYCPFNTLMVPTFPYLPCKDLNW